VFIAVVELLGFSHSVVEGCGGNLGLFELEGLVLMFCFAPELFVTAYVVPFPFL
jgi:hypothetical protein